jgi:cell division protein ZapE
VTLLTLFKSKLPEGKNPDEHQRHAIDLLQKCYDRLTVPAPRKNAMAGLFGRKKNAPEIRGLYIWGDVGRGKTFLMDIFFETLPIKEKLRLHYHDGFREIHNELKTLSNTANPLKRVAARIAEHNRVVFIDEFHVDDITDAMIIHGLLDALFELDVTLIMTSNTPIEKLYLNGLQRERFLPAIELLKKNTESVHLAGNMDYRTQFDIEHAKYRVLTGDDSHSFLDHYSAQLPQANTQRQTTIDLNRRPLQVEAAGDNWVWTKFSALCATAKSATDYTELAQRFSTVLLEDIPVMNDGKNDWAQRFIQLIDALYDKKTVLISTGAAEPAELYLGKALAAAFKRTVSRLQEMRSVNYPPRTDARGERS